MTLLAPSPLAALDDLESRLTPLRAQLTAHPLYASIRTLDHVRCFMESHVFAVWDCMSLLKCLQRRLTCVRIPWTPTPYPASRRILNQLILSEESDDFDGRPLSHFEIYLEAMQAIGADTIPMLRVVKAAATSFNWQSTLHQVAPTPARRFVDSTFDTVRQGSLVAQAATFTFGREGVIPELFRNFLHRLNNDLSGSLSTFLWYLERHVEADGVDQPPLSLPMISDLCGDNPALWTEATQAAEAAMRARVALWDGILVQIRQQS